MSTLGIFLIVKNESKIIERCLNSCKFADVFVITDTGSTDDTPNIITNWISSNNKLGTVIQDTFDDYGSARTRSYNNIANYTYKPKYVITIDADQFFVVQNKQLLIDYLDQHIAPNYTITLTNNNIKYPNVRIFNTDYDHICVNRCHEVWRTKLDQFLSQEIEIPEHLIYTDDYDDGGNKPTKYIRERDLLLQDLNDNVSLPRTHFYLGQTYRGLKDNQSAISHYKKCVSSTNYIDEKYYAYYSIGICYLEQSNLKSAFKYFLLANETTDRYEALHAMVKILRNNHKFKAAYCLLTQFPASYTPPNRLFIDTHINALFDEERSIIGYYLGKNELLSCERLILTQDYIDPMSRNQARSNSFYYLKQLPNALFKPYEHESTIKYLESIGLVRSQIGIMNPSMIKIDEYTQLVNIRVVNYHIICGQYIIHDPDNIVRTRNFLLTTDNDLNPISHTELIVKAKYTHTATRNFGLEDIRMVLSHNRKYVYISGTSWELYPDQPGPKIGYGKFKLRHIHDPEIKINIQSIDYGTNCEKNWMPYLDGKDLRFIYELGPKIKTILRTCKDIIDVKEHPVSILSHDFRGGAVTTLPDNNKLAIIHEVLPREGPRTYTHRFILIDSDVTTIKKVSVPFYFLSLGIEFCCSITVVMDDIILLVGRDDNNCIAVKIPIYSIYELMN